MKNKPKRPRGSGRIWKKNETYWVQFYDSHGRQIRMSAKTNNPDAAEKFLRRKLGEVAAGVDVDRRRLKYEDIRNCYLGERLARSDKSLRRQRDGSLVLDKDGLPTIHAVALLDEFFRGTIVRTIDSDALNRFVAGLRRQGYAVATINRSTASLRRMFNLAREQGKLREVPHFQKLPERNVRVGFFERREYLALFTALPVHIRPVFAIAYWTGLRAGEIAGLRWTQIDFLSGFIRLNPFETKNDEARSAPMSSELATILRAHRAACPDKHFSFLAYKVKRSGVQRLGVFLHAWRKACIAAGLGGMSEDGVYRGKLFHDLRRTGVRNLVRAGVPESVAMRISGHRTRSVFERYNITDERDLQNAGVKLENYIKVQDSVGANSGQIDVPNEEKRALTN